MYHQFYSDNYASPSIYNSTLIAFIGYERNRCTNYIKVRLDKTLMSPRISMTREICFLTLKHEIIETTVCIIYHYYILLNEQF